MLNTGFQMGKGIISSCSDLLDLKRLRKTSRLAPFPMQTFIVPGSFHQAIF